MKFRDGMWFVKEGMKVEYAVEVSQENTEIRDDGKTVHVLCPTRSVKSRSGAIDTSALNLDITAHSSGIISVETTHWAGTRRRGPFFELYPHGKPECHPSIKHGDGYISLSSGELTCKVNTATEGFGIQFSDQSRPNRTLTSFDFRSLGLAYANPPTQSRSLAHSLDNVGCYIVAQLSMAVGEKIYGFGEQFTEFVKNGQRIRAFNENGGTSSEQAYKAIPFYLTNRGYGVFVDHTELVDFEVGSERSARCQFSVEGQRLKFYIINGPTPKDIIQKYCLLTGRPSLPPAWSFGLWLSTSFTTNWNEESIEGFMTRMKELDSPVHTLHLDSFWMRRFRFCDFTFNNNVFDNPRSTIARLKSNFNVHICVWINAYIAQESPLFQEGMDNNYLIRRRNGDVWQWDYWQPGMGIVDFTNPAARKWYASYLHKLVDIGVDSFKTDFGEDVPYIDAQFHDGSDPKKMHNYFAQLYNEVVFGVLKERFGEGKACVFARSATAGGQRMPCHWSGDSESTAVAMAETLRGGLSLSTTGFGYFSHDVGGFEGNPPADLYKRWVAFGLLSTHSRLHGSESYRVPWNYDDEACDVLRLFTKLKCRLMPYLYSQAVINAKTGIPILRPMFFDFGDDPTAWTLDRQYMLGDYLMVAPVFEADGRVEFYLPAGKWTRWFGSDRGDSGQVVQGPKWMQETYSMLSLALFVREGSVLVLGQDGEGRVEYDYTSDVEIRCYNVSGEVERLLVDMEGEEIGSVKVNGTKVEVPQSMKRWKAVDHAGNLLAELK
ncbi:hypothetical protein H2202_004301 [Exophiala xenobiotica]|nr:hypothetical protein H2202_004301 [Exophiala xenobiotica]KAK5218811.1 hypothetical protein LTR72_008751 [Exophiala xenobiotica]KAK5290217.1 hypothetical protein LTR14_006519 [Exophiala xenobiotica]KAK5319703.1 hypothetical protein LTR93_007624 [Exophiala xenobiotica]KAK5480242.1 hypothetical protein LTR55_007606 [Exophiala xenobiotica]